MWKDVEAVLRGVPSQVLCSYQGSEGGECGGAGGGMVGSDRSEPAFCQYEYVLVVCQPAGLYFTQWRAHIRGATLPLPSLPAAKMHQLIITLAPRSINKPSRQEKQSETQTISDPLACSVIARAQPARKVRAPAAHFPCFYPSPPTLSPYPFYYSLFPSPSFKVEVRVGPRDGCRRARSMPSSSTASLHGPSSRLDVCMRLPKGPALPAGGSTAGSVLDERHH